MFACLAWGGAEDRRGGEGRELTRRKELGKGDRERNRKRERERESKPGASLPAGSAWEWGGQERDTGAKSKRILLATASGPMVQRFVALERGPPPPSPQIFAK